MKKQTLQQIFAVIFSLVIVFLAYAYVSGGKSVFRGQMEGKVIRARVIRVMDSKSSNVTGDGEIVTLEFKAQCLNTDLRGKTINAIQEIDKSYAFSPREVQQNDTILIESYTVDGVTQYYFGDYSRIGPLIWLGIIFCILVVVFSKTQGIKTLVSLGLTCISVFMVLIPAILGGRNIYLWTILVCVYMIIMTLSIISGINKKALCAAIGCFCGVASAGIITLIMGLFLNMTGMLEEESVYLLQLYPDNPIDLRAVIFSMITIGALGAVMDVSMSISSSLSELKEKSPSITPKELMKSGFTIGRDMMGTMANTLVLAYIGSSLTCVLLLVSYNASLTQVLNKEKIIAEILQALAGSMGMLLTLPLTSAVCAVIYYRKVSKNVTDKNESASG